MSGTIEDRVDAYLDGALDADGTAAFERDLARPEVAAALGSALAIRGLIATARVPPVPEGLEEGVMRSMGVAPSRDRAPGVGRSVLSGFLWSVRGPAMALSPGTGGERGRSLGERVRAGAFARLNPFARRGGK